VTIRLNISAGFGSARGQGQAPLDGDNIAYMSAGMPASGYTDPPYVDVSNNAVFKWHLECCTCIATPPAAACFQQFYPANEDSDYEVTNDFNVVGTGVYSLVYDIFGQPQSLAVSGVVHFLQKVEVPFDEQYLHLQSWPRFTNDSDKLTWRVMGDYIDEDNYAFASVTASGNGNYSGYLGIRISGTDNELQGLTRYTSYSDGFSCTEEYSDPISEPPTITLSTGYRALYSVLHGSGFHSEYSMHGGNKVGFGVTEQVGDAYLSVDFFNSEDHRNWGTTTGYGGGTTECIDQGRCACGGSSPNGESPDTWKVVISTLEGVPVNPSCTPTFDYDSCCSSLNGTYILEGNGGDLHAIVSTDKPLCEYMHRMESPCYQPVYGEQRYLYITLTTWVQGNSPPTNRIDVSARQCSIALCEEGGWTWTTYTFGSWGKDYGNARYTAIPCKTLNNEGLDYIGTTLWKYYPCSGIAEYSCRVTAL
jgi:hypothetical protein